MSSLVLSGDTSGTITVSVPAVAGTNTVTIPAATGTLAFDETGSYTTTATGYTTSPTGTVYYAIAGNIVTLTTPAFAATSNATTFTLTGMPESLYPTRLQYLLFRTADASASTFSMAVGTISNAGVISFSKDISGNAFTASGTKQVAAQTVTYSLA